MASAEAVARRRANRRLRKQIKRQRGKMRAEPIAVQIAMNGSNGDGPLSRYVRWLLNQFYEWRERQIRMMVYRGELRWGAFSFQYWLLRRCQLSERHFRPDDPSLTDAEANAIAERDWFKTWKWWVRVHELNQLEFSKIPIPKDK